MTDTAWTELEEELWKGEVIEFIVFGDWGWSGYSEPDPAPVPDEMKCIRLTPEQAKPLMQSWNIAGGHGAPDCYAMYVWTNKRVLWITQYDGATWLSHAPRNPPGDGERISVDMPGG